MFYFVLCRFEQKLWIATMFTGCATVYAARTAVPLCIVAISKEMNWDKKQSVRWTMVLTCKNLKFSLTFSHWLMKHCFHVLYSF